MKNSDFTVIIPSHRPKLAVDAAYSMFPIIAKIHANDGCVSFSRLINDCILSCSTETVIVCNDKARPTASHEWLTLSRLAEGFGFVGMHNFRHFGFHKDLIRKIGFFDERFIGGEYEDFDFMRRIQEADIAVYMSKEIPCVELPCSWNNEKSYRWNHTKWKECITHTDRLLPDETYPYDIGPSTSTVFKSWRESQWVNQVPPREFQI